MGKSDRTGNWKSATHSRKTRRGFLQVASVGGVGIAGCTSFGLGDDETPTSELSTLFATWRGHDPSSTITLQWLAPITDRSDPVPVEVSAMDGTSETDEQTTVVLFGESDLVRHRAVLTDLESDSEYYVTVANSETGLTVRTAPNELTEPITFAEGGDVGTSSAVPPLHQQAASWDPLFGLVGGDLAYADGVDVEEWITFLEQWNEHMRSDDRLIPLVAAMGGHELKGNDEFFGTPEEAPFYYALFDNVYREHAYWALDIGADISILLLDSNHTTDVAGAQTEWLESALAKRAGRDHLMTISHIPAYPCAKPIEDEERGDIRQHWTPLFEEYNVDAIFEHDDHAYKRTHRLRGGETDSEDGVLYIGDGAWGKDPRDVYSPEERPYLDVSESTRYVLRTEINPNGSQEFLAIGSNGETIDHFDGAGAPL